LSIGLYIVLAPLYLKSVRKLQEKRFVFVKILAIIIPENGAKVSKIKCFQFAQQTLDKLSEKEGVRIVSFSISDAAVKTTNNGQDVLQAGKRLEVSMMIYMTRGSSDGK